VTVTIKPNTYSTKINGLKISLLLFLVWFGFKGFCQTPSVVVSEYYNSAGNDEWIELLVINDNTDLRGYTIRDNGGSHRSWINTSSYGVATFANISLWNNLRAGTIIIIYLRSTGLSPSGIDTLKTDGFIQIHSQYSGYLNGTALTIGGGGDIIQLRTQNKDHIHALAHRDSIPSYDFNDSIISNHKLNHFNLSGVASGNNVSICPGGSINDYIGGTSDTLKTSEGASYITQGLPNKRASDTTSNLAYWRSLRQPPFTGITLNTPIDSFAFGKIGLTWTTAGWTDPDSTDGTVGYIILRNTTNSFVPPTDGKTYSTLDTVGTASVSGHVNLSPTLAYSDNYTFNCGTTYYYKIYAFRYTTNGVLGTARGRAYNETGSNFSVITKPYPTAQSINPN
jgi:hypothetical protein